MLDLYVPTTTMKAISLRQPWASLVAYGLKQHETRHWPTDYRGPIAIHAAKRLDLAGAPDRLCQSAFGFAWMDGLPLGAIVAIAHLTAVARSQDVIAELTRADQAAGNFGPARYAWRLEDVRALKAPVPCIGRQGLFNWSPPADLGGCLSPVRDHRKICHQSGWA
jgi:hypothetical protein